MEFGCCQSLFRYSLRSLSLLPDIEMPMSGGKEGLDTRRWVEMERTSDGFDGLEREGNRRAKAKN